MEVSSELGFLRKSLGTLKALIWPLAFVCEQVLRQMIALREALRA